MTCILGLAWRLRQVDAAVVPLNSPSTHQALACCTVRCNLTDVRQWPSLQHCRRMSICNTCLALVQLCKDAPMGAPPRPGCGSIWCSTGSQCWSGWRCWGTRRCHVCGGNAIRRSRCRRLSGGWRCFSRSCQCSTCTLCGARQRDSFVRFARHMLLGLRRLLQRWQARYCSSGRSSGSLRCRCSGLRWSLWCGGRWLALGCGHACAERGRERALRLRGACGPCFAFLAAGLLRCLLLLPAQRNSLSAIVGSRSHVGMRLQRTRPWTMCRMMLNPSRCQWCKLDSASSKRPPAGHT